MLPDTVSYLRQKSHFCTLIAIFSYIVHSRNTWHLLAIPED